MTLLPSVEDLSASSGILNIGLLNSIYKSVMDEALLDMGRTVTLHLPPTKVQDETTQSQQQPSQYNPYFGRVQAPKTNRRNTGVTITPRDIDFTGHIRIGPKSGDDAMGIGDLAANEVAVTLDITALEYVSQAHSMSIEGRRYEIDSSRPVGLTGREYVIVRGTEIDSHTNAQSGTDG